MGGTVTIEHHGQVAVVTIDNPPVNALSHAVRVGLLQAFDVLEADGQTKAVVLACAGRSFSAGADLAELGAAPRDPSMGAVMRRIEASSLPLVAAIQGQALGGGLETALLCDHRVVAADARLGLPEINLGLIPGGGGTQRLPRLIGVSPALDLILAGKPIGAEAAIALDLVDEIAADDLIGAAVTAAEGLAGRPDGRRRMSEAPLANGEGFDFAERRRRALSAANGLAAAGFVVDAVGASTQLDLEAGLIEEARLFQASRTAPESRALRHLFAGERQVGRIAALADVAARPVERVAVIGAGTMGVGVVLSLLDAGLSVTVVETAQAALDRGVSVIRSTYEKLVERGRLSDAARTERLGRLTPALELTAAAPADLVIECVFEDLAVKQALFARLGQVLAPGAILATNTSALDVDRIAQASGRPADVVGLHFFSPANIMKLLEVVRAAETAPDVLATALALAKRLGKIGVVCGVCDGFIGNRMIGGYLREAGLLLLEGASPEQIDTALKQFGMAMGPHAMGDLAGLDIQAAGRARRRAEGRLPDDPRLGAVGDALVAAGRLGLKTGKGVYAYDEGSRDPIPDPEVAALIAREAERLGVARRGFDDEEVVLRCLLPLVNEGARIVEEGVALGPVDIDVVYANGYGFPRTRGGPMFWADELGVATVLEHIRGFAETLPGGYWTPAPLLERLAASGGAFGQLPRREIVFGA